VPLTAQQHQGLHGEGFIFALASSAGLVVMRSNLDVDGVDWLIAHPGPVGTVRSPKIEMQVKTWSAPHERGGAWQFRMAARHFNALAGPGFELRRYLGLVTVPGDPGGYASCETSRMSLGHAAYWVSLADQEPYPRAGEDSQTVLVPVPQRNLLTPATLKALVRGEDLGAVV
jgi:hypothetical protein